MFPQVQLQQIIRGEILATLAAQVRLRVRGHVIAKIVLKGEGLAAHDAFILLGHRLTEHLLVKVTPRPKFLFAERPQHIRRSIAGRFVFH